MPLNRETAVIIGNEPVNEVLVRRHERGGYEVLVTVGRETLTSEQLCFGEMLEQVIRLLPPPPHPHKHYAMRTQEEWDAPLTNHATTPTGPLE